MGTLDKIRQTAAAQAAQAQTDQQMYDQKMVEYIEREIAPRLVADVDKRFGVEDPQITLLGYDGEHTPTYRYFLPRMDVTFHVRLGDVALLETRVSQKHETRTIKYYVVHGRRFKLRRVEVTNAGELLAAAK
jgi:hypothetical protein